MIKNIIKEIGIAIMLLIAIALILSIIFYQYIPNNKTVPIAVKAYTMPEDINQELEESINQEEQNIIMTKYINNDELDVYESKNYNKGKANPFADYSSNESNSTQTDSGTAGNNQSNTNTSSSKDNTTGNITENKTGSTNENTTRNEVYVSTPGKN